MSEPEFLGLSGADARDPVKRLRAVVEQAVVLYRMQVDQIEREANEGDVLEHDQEWQFWSGHLITAQDALGVVDDAEKLASDAVARAVGSPSERSEP